MGKPTEITVFIKKIIDKIAGENSVYTEATGLIETSLIKSPDGVCIVTDSFLLELNPSDYEKIGGDAGIARLQNRLRKYARQREYQLAENITLSVRRRDDLASGKMTIAALPHSAEYIGLTLEATWAGRTVAKVICPGEKISMGRNETNGLVICEAHISSTHLEIEFTPTFEIIVTDKDSSNGTYLRAFGRDKKLSGRAVVNNGATILLNSENPVELKVYICRRKG